MSDQFSYEETCLCAMLSEALLGRCDSTRGHLWEQQAPDWAALFSMAEKHAVLPLLYDILEPCGEISDAQKQMYVRSARSTALQNYRLLFLTRYLVQKLQKQGISVIVLKGVATAALYPVPEMRKSGDVDLLVPDASQFARACTVLEEAGLVLSEEQHANHHVVYRTREGIDVELHSIFSEPFDQDAINDYMLAQTKDAARHCTVDDVMGVLLPVLQTPYHAYQLLLHMLQHFLRAGFGLKLVCDWVVISRRPWTDSEKQTLTKLVRESKIEGFAEMITSICVHFLGLEPEHALFRTLDAQQTALYLKDILEAEEFGHASADRMVMLRGGGFFSLVREFHYQMRLTYPKASKCVLCWPVLWVMALHGFLHRNRTLRHVSTRAVLDKAKERGRLRKNLQLFKR